MHDEYLAARGVAGVCSIPGPDVLVTFCRVMHDEYLVHEASPAECARSRPDVLDT